MYKVVMKSWGGTRRDFSTRLTEKDAYEICEAYGWEYQVNGEGYIWELEIEEE